TVIDPNNLARLASGATRPLGVAAANRADWCRDRTRIFLCPAERGVACFGGRAESRSRATSRFGLSVPERHAARRDLHLQACVSAGCSLPKHAAEYSTTTACADRQIA